MQNAVATELAPDRIPLSTSQAQRLAGLTEMDANNFAGRTIAEIKDRFQWQIDSKYLRFERVCGQVVTTSGSTGAADPVPSATVLLEVASDSKTESLAGEVEAGVAARSVTDAQGRFRLWVPRFEIEWMLRGCDVETVHGLFFRVMQDLDGGDTQVMICPSTRWNVPQVLGVISDVLLQASCNAVSTTMSSLAELCDDCAVGSHEVRRD